MGFSKEIYMIAQEKLRARRNEALSAANERYARFTEINPEYKKLESELAKTSIQLTRAIFGSNSDVTSTVEQIKQNNLRAQEQMRGVLRKNGLPENYLEPSFSCAECGDTGICDGKICECMRKLMRQTAFEQLNAITPLSLSTFESFSLDVYPTTVDSSKGVSPRKMMEITYKKCKRYAEDFSLASPSLLLQGGVGLGKTHLSLAIAGVVIGKGYDVVYGTAQGFLGKIERERFGKAPAGDDTLSLLCQADLLIMDDLGTEFVTPFTVSVLHDLINSRLLSGRPTIISTNLNFDGLSQKYSERLISRIHGSYNRFQFVGKDMRIVLRKARTESK